MIHKDLLADIEKRQSWEGFLKPDYGSFSIAEVTPSILEYFGIAHQRPTFKERLFDRYGKKFSKVILFVIDGLGFDHFLTYHEQMSFLSRFEERGDVFPLTSVFPSTTPAALTTIHTGMTPQEHGLPEWFVYFEELKGVIETLPFKMIRTSEPNALLRHGGTAEMLYDGRTVYERLAEAGIASHNFVYHEYIQGAYQSAISKGSEAVAFTHGNDLVQKLKDKLVNTNGPAFFLVYWHFIDQVEHSFGPNSKEHVSELESFSNLFTSRFLGELDKTAAGDVLVLLTADHGQSNIKGEDIIYLNKYLELTAKYAWMHKKEIIPPTGAPHDVFLFIHPPELNSAIKLLQQELTGQAKVLPTQQALKSGLFGLHKPSEKFLRRIGNVLILPLPDHHVWYDHFPGYPFHQKGVHGGLSHAEMLVPFCVCPLEKLL